MSFMFEIYDCLIQELKIQGSHCGSGCLVSDSVLDLQYLILLKAEQLMKYTVG